MDKYSFDLTRLIKDEKDFNEKINEVKNSVDELCNYKNKILQNSSNLYNVLSLDEKISLLINKLYVYSHLSYYKNMSDIKAQEYRERVLSLLNNISGKISFITPELLKSSYDLVKSYIKENNNLKKYELYLSRIFRYKKHVLLEKEEKILSDVNDVLNGYKHSYEELNDNDSYFGKIKDENDNKVLLTSSNYGVFLSSKNRKVRKDAFNKKYKFYKEHINTIGSLYINQVKANTFISKTRKYKSTLEMELFDDNIDLELYYNLIDATNKNIKYLNKYYDIKSKSLNMKMHMYDLYVNTSKLPNKKVEYSEAIKIINKALKPLGQEYLEKFNYLVNNNCIDVYPKDKKRSGAFEWGSYKVLPYVSLNYENNIDSLSTFAHEMGHAMHSFYSDSNNDYIYASYPIFLAEIASTVNEILLSEYMYYNTNDKDEKIYYLEEFLDKFKATVFRQIMFSEFESTVHDKYEKDGILTTEMLCKIYYDLNKKHFGKSVVVDENIKYEWARIPHFYDSFYVYKYASGFISALLIVDKLLKDDNYKDKYIDFLKSGNKMFPLDLLKSIDIDLTNENTINEAFNIFNKKLNDLERIEYGE